MRYRVRNFDRAIKIVRTYLLIMNLEVLLEIGARSELLVAYLADVGFLSSVYSLMPNQVRNLYC